MLSPKLFYTKQAVRRIEALQLVRTGRAPVAGSKMTESTAQKIRKYPLLLNTHSPESADTAAFNFSIFNRHESARSLFTSLLGVLGGEREAQGECRDLVQPTLLEKVTKYQQAHKMRLQVDKVAINSIKAVQTMTIHGFFIHRELNMPWSSYSFERESENKIVMRMKAKFGNQLQLGKFLTKTRLYESSDRKYPIFYVDSYQNFTRHDKIVRRLYEINTHIQGSLLLNDRALPLPPQTTHLLQVEMVEIKGRLELENSIVTDIDFFMEGNPHTA